MMYRNIFHWGPLLALGMIKLISITTIHCTVLWLPYHTSVIGILNGIVFFLLAFLTVYNFLFAICIGPGFVPLNWRPVRRENEVFLQFCQTCNALKAPRSHHCRKCRRCVMKMDHHCPWLNNCVGHFNHGYFVMFLFSAICGCFHSTILLIITVYKFFNTGKYYSQGLTPPVKLTLEALICCIFSTGLAIGVFLALSFLLYTQMKSVLRNRTGIEDWILEKAEERRNEDPTLTPFIYPYNLGWYHNFRQVFHKGLTPKGDGITWSLRKGCSEYDLTIEQLKQKELKNIRKKPFKVIKKYSGAIFPLVNGFCTCIHPPCSTDNRISVDLEDTILVTRYAKYWLFGEKWTVEPERYKGWFPRSCVVPLTDCQKYIKKRL